MNAYVIAACLLAGLLGSGTAAADCDDGRRLTGVNLAGAEFKPRRLPGIMNKDYTYPRATEYAYYAGKGATAIRLPVSWERLQPTPMGELDAAQVKAIAEVLTRAAEKRLCVILDVHNYGLYRDQPIGSEAVPEAAFIDLWRRVAQRFPDPARIALGLMNEPKSLYISRWAGLAQATITALRDAGSRHLILVAGGRWSGVHDWFKVGTDTSNALAMAGLTDPLGRMALDVHQYVNSNYSGATTDCRPAEHFDAMFQKIAEWAATNGQRLFLGEFGVPGTPECLVVLEHLLGLTDDRQVWLGWTYWAGGSWWGSYPLSIAPRADGSDAPQMGVASRYFGL